jgi:hypothetical protein
MTGVEEHEVHVALAKEATAAGLIVTQLMPHPCGHIVERPEEYAIQLWGADGSLWAEARHESEDSVRGHIAGYVARRAAAEEGP